MNTIGIRNKIKSENTTSLRIENITTNKYLIIFTDNSDLTIEKNSEKLFFPQGSFVFIERGLRFSCKIRKYTPEKKPFKIISLDKEELVILKNVLKSTYGYYLDENEQQRKLSHKIIGIEGYSESIQVFDRITLVEETSIKIFKVAYIISRQGRIKDIINSVIISAATTFTDKVRDKIENNISKKWRLNNIADEFNISEISVRKRLESEGTSFNNLLIELRMNKAMQLLLENEKQIHQISRDIGIFSPSYFIKNFKSYFGITPKQFVIYFRS